MFLLSWVVNNEEGTISISYETSVYSELYLVLLLTVLLIY